MANPAETVRMRLRLRIHHVPGGGRLRRVITAASPLRHTHITKLLWQHIGALIGSRADLLRLGALFRLAAVSPHSAVFLPLRANEPGETVAYWADGPGFADLVVVRRDVPLRPSTWPAIRASLRRGPRPGVPATMLAPAPRPVTYDQGWDEARHRLSVVEYADTLVLSGTARALYAAGDELTWCGNEVAVNSDIRRYGGPALLSQFSGPDRCPGRRDASWECMVLAEDQIFHRNRWLRLRPGPVPGQSTRADPPRQASRGGPTVTVRAVDWRVRSANRGGPGRRRGC